MGKVTAEALRRRAEEAWALADGGLSTAGVAGALGVSRATAKRLLAMRRLAPEVWPLADAGGRVVLALVALAHEPEGVQRRAAFRLAGAPRIGPAEVAAAVKEVAGDAGGGAGAEEAAVLNAEIAAKRRELEELRRRIAMAERELGRKRAGIEFMNVGRRAVRQLEREEEALRELARCDLSDGVFRPEVRRWIGTLERVKGVFEEVLDRYDLDAAEVVVLETAADGG